MVIPQPRNTSKIRAAWLSPCIGIGGADAYMLGLCRHAYNVQWTGIAVDQQISIDSYEWYHNMTGGSIPLHAVDRPTQYRIEGNIQYHNDMSHAIRSAAIDADIIITWCMPNIRHHLWSLERPVIELAQNTDEFAKECCRSNDDYVSFRAACSKAAAEAFPNPSEVDAILYNAIDTSRVSPRYGRELTRKMWGVEDRKVLLFMGRLVEEKNPQAIVQAMQNLPEEWIGIIVGSGYLKESFLKEAARYCPGRLLMLDSVYHMGDVLAASDVFCLPTDFEGHPLAVCEAWMAGIPVVITDIPVIQELTEMYGPLATTVPLRPSPEVLSAAIIAAGDQTPEVLDRLNRARYVTWEHFTLPAASVKWEEFLSACISKWQRYQRRFEIHPVGSLGPKKSSFTRIRTTEGR